MSEHEPQSGNRTPVIPGTRSEACRAAVLALASLPRMGPTRLAAILAAGDPVPQWEAVRAGRPKIAPDAVRAAPDALLEQWRVAARAIDPDHLLADHRDGGVDVLLAAGDELPARLRDDPEPPTLLTVLGDIDDSYPSVAIVGTRRCTAYGRDVARRLGHGLASCGVSVVSGLAAGIDAAAHRGALAAAGAPPIGVVATGLDVVYPRRNADLWEAVAAEGALLSEWPLGSRPNRWRFPARNRLIAGQADAVVVVESHERGGSLYTVAAAEERSRPVFAVPGPVTSPASAGCNGLLVDGVAPARDVEDVLIALGLGGSSPSPRRQPGSVSSGAPSELPADLRELWSALDPTPTSVDTVVLRTGLDVVGVHASLRRLRASGWADESGGWWWQCSAQR